MSRTRRTARPAVCGNTFTRKPGRTPPARSCPPGTKPATGPTPRPQAIGSPAPTLPRWCLPLMQARVAQLEQQLLEPRHRAWRQWLPRTYPAHRNRVPPRPDQSSQPFGRWQRSDVQRLGLRTLRQCPPPTRPAAVPVSLPGLLRKSLCLLLSATLQKVKCPPMSHHTPRQSTTPRPVLPPTMFSTCEYCTSPKSEVKDYAQLNRAMP